MNIGREKKHRPVLREAPTGSDLLTWGEFIEAGHLAAYRREQRVPLPELRSYIDWWRQQLGIPYPLAHQQPYVAPWPGLMDTVEEDGGIRVMYRFGDGQTSLMPWAREFVHKVEFDGDVARRYWPSGRDQRVLIDPSRSFGAPIVEGIRTEVLFEMFLAGDPVDEIADGYGLDSSVVEAAIWFESPRSKQAANAAAGDTAIRKLAPWDAVLFARYPAEASSPGPTASASYWGRFSSWMDCRRSLGSTPTSPESRVDGVAQQLFLGSDRFGRWPTVALPSSFARGANHGSNSRPRMSVCPCRVHGV